jgi:hypothetical protein
VTSDATWSSSTANTLRTITTNFTNADGDNTPGITASIAHLEADIGRDGGLALLMPVFVPGPDRGVWDFSDGAPAALGKAESLPDGPMGQESAEAIVARIVEGGK